MVKEAIKIRKQSIRLHKKLVILKYLFIIACMKNDDKKIRRNKDHLYTTTVRTKQTFDSDNTCVLNDIIVLFNKQKRHWLNYSDHSPTGRKNFMHQQAQFFEKMPYNYRFFQGIRQEIQGITESIKSIYSFTPYDIIEKLNLKSPIYQRLAAYGHLGRKDCSWEEIDTVDEILSKIRKKSF